MLRAFLLELVYEAAARVWDCKALKITTGFHVGENSQGRGSVLAEAQTSDVPYLILFPEVSVKPFHELVREAFSLTSSRTEMSQGSSPAVREPLGRVGREEKQGGHLKRVSAGSRPCLRW